MYRGAAPGFPPQEGDAYPYADSGPARGAEAYDSLLRDSGATFIADAGPGGGAAAGSAALGVRGPNLASYTAGTYSTQHLAYGAPHASGGGGYDVGYGPPAGASSSQAYVPLDGYGLEPTYSDHGRGGYSGRPEAHSGGGGAFTPPTGAQQDWGERLYQNAQKPTTSSYAQMFREGQQREHSAPSPSSSSTGGGGANGGVKAGRRASAKARGQRDAPAPAPPPWDSNFTDGPGWLDSDEYAAKKQEAAELRVQHERETKTRERSQAQATAAARAPAQARQRAQADRRAQAATQEREWEQGQHTYQARRNGGKTRPRGGPFDEQPGNDSSRGGGGVGRGGGRGGGDGGGTVRGGGARQSSYPARQDSPMLPAERSRQQRHGDGGGGGQQPSTASSFSALGGRVSDDLRSLKPSQLRDRCEAAGVPKSQLDACLDSDHPKSEYIKLLEQEARSSGGRPRQAAQRRPAPASASSVRSSVGGGGGGRPMSR